MTVAKFLLLRLALALYAAEPTAAKLIVARQSTAAGAVPCMEPECFHDPTVWGPPTWQFLHSMAWSQQDPIPAEQQRHIANFINEELGPLLPCPVCGNNVKKHLKVLPPVTEALEAGRDELGCWVVKLHNMVNKDLDKPLLSCNEAKGLLADKFARKAPAPEKGTSVLQRVTDRRSALVGPAAFARPVGQKNAAAKGSILNQSLAGTAAVDCAGQPRVDHSLLDGFLKEFRRPPALLEGIKTAPFDYRAVLAAPDKLAVLERYVQMLASVPGTQVDCLTRDGQLAFWLNAYNGLVLWRVFSASKAAGGKLPKSIRELGKDGTAVWDLPAGNVSGVSMSLEEVEQKARDFHDARVHAALNCASISCPDLHAGAFSAEELDKELDEGFKQLLENDSKGMRQGAAGELEVSSVFCFFPQDFARNESPDVAKSCLLCGKDQRAELAARTFIGKYRSVPQSEKIGKCIPWNWNLNDASGATPLP